MEKVLGIGGFFFKAKDWRSLKAWYGKHLGVTPGAETYDELGWRAGGGVTVFEPFDQEAEYFGAPSQSWMINFRVRDLDKMVAQLRAAGIAVDRDPKVYPNGHFARLSDPEGNPIQLWQPTGKYLSADEAETS